MPRNTLRINIYKYITTKRAIFILFDFPGETANSAVVEINERLLEYWNVYVTRNFRKI